MKYNKIIAFCCICLGLFVVGCERQEILDDIETTKETIQPTTQEEVIAPTAGGTLKIAIRNPKTLNPLLNEDESVDQFLNLIYDKLITLDENEKPMPNIASSWELSGDAKTLTVHIRNDITWHDGTSLTSKDVLFSLDTIKKSSQESAYKPCINNIASYSNSDNYTVTINYNKPFSGYLNALNFPIISKDYYDKEDVLLSNKNMSPLGTGAYKVNSVEIMKEINLNKNDSWFKGLPYIDSIKALIIPKKEAELYAFNQGQISLISTDVVDWEKYGVTKDTNIYEYTTNYCDFIGVNFNKAPLNDKLVRQAIAYAIPKEEIISEIYLDHAVATDTPIKPKSWLNTKKEIKYKLDNAKAIELLKQAGWEDLDSDGLVEKDGQAFKFSLLVNQENSQRLESAYRIQIALKKIGIDMAIDVQNFESYKQKLTDKSFDAFLGGWRLSNIPDFTFAFHSANITLGSNFISYNNMTMNSLLEIANASTNEASTKQAYKDLEEHIVEELPYISLYFKNAAVLTEGSVKGVIRSDINNIYLGIKDWFIYQK